MIASARAPPLSRPRPRDASNNPFRYQRCHIASVVMPNAVERQATTSNPVFDTLQYERAAMAFLRCAQLRQRQPMHSNNTVIKLPTCFDMVQPAVKGKAQIGDVTCRYGPLVNADQCAWCHDATGLFQRLAGTGVYQRLFGFQMTGWLVKA